MDSRSHTGSEVGWAGGDVAEMVVVLVLPTVVQYVLFDVAKTAAPPFKHFLQVASFLHRDDLYTKETVMRCRPYLT